MSADTAIRISNLSKAYRIDKSDGPRATNLGEAITQRFKKPLKRSEKETFWALKDIDLEIERGEVVGVIGRNGAGKSTLLKVLSRITEPTTGRIELFGRTGSLLEVGTGFHPELTGRENIFLNGAILGMRRSEIKRQFDEIVDFAGVEQFLDTPVKRYSSGMYVRLAFAVAAHLNPEILIVDEVLAVGDAEFQRKCLGKMQDVAQSGRSVLFVSHNMDAIRRLCSSIIFLEHGSLRNKGHVDPILAEYSRHSSSLSNEIGKPLSKEVILDSCKIVAKDGRVTNLLRFGEPFEVHTAWSKFQVSGAAVTLRLFDSSDRLMCVNNTVGQQLHIKCEVELRCSYNSNPLVPGDYRIEIEVWELPGRKLSGNNRIGFTVNDVAYDPAFSYTSRSQTILAIPTAWSAT